MIVGGYTLHLYCDHPGHNGWSYEGKHYVRTEHNPHGEHLQDEFAGNNERDARANARAWGWVFQRERRVICPFCAKLDK
jgi:hypothetical protein